MELSSENYETFEGIQSTNVRQYDSVEILDCKRNSYIIWYSTGPAIIKFRVHNDATIREFGHKYCKDGKIQYDRIKTAIEIVRGIQINSPDDETKWYTSWFSS
jgi:hypothetical protein